MSVAAVRAALEEALGAGRLAEAAPEQNLLEAGLVSSIELVTLFAALEQAFGVEIPPPLANQHALGSLQRMADFVGGAGGSPAAPVWQPSALARSLRRVLRRPLRALLLFALALWLCDAAWGVWVRRLHPEGFREYLEQGQRLYPGQGELAHDDYAAAVAEHEVQQEARGASVWVLGDSGTIGSYMEAEEAYPALAEAALRRAGREVEVYNLAFYGRLVAKDLAILEALWERPAQVVVFSLSEDAFGRSMTRGWVEKYAHVTYNHGLLARFAGRLEPGEQAHFRETLERMQAADRRRLGWLRRGAQRAFHLPATRGYLKRLLLDRALPGGLSTPLRRDLQVRERSHRLQGPAREGIPRADFDRAALGQLDAATRLLRARGVEVILLLLPRGPRAWQRPLGPGTLHSAPALRALAQARGARLVDARWILEREGFLDNLLHFSAAGNRALAAALTPALQAALGGP